MNLEINFFELDKQEFELHIFVRRVGDSEKKLTIENSRLANFRYKNVKELYEVSMVNYDGFYKKLYQV